MTNKIKYQNIEIEFSEIGEGRVIVLLHGYMESLSVWDDFAEKLSGNYRVVSIDLPGHGNSGVIEQVHTMKLMASIVDEVVNHLNIEKFSLIGHSMGGYVTLEYLSKYPQKLESYCLFHSTPFADTDQKRQERNRIIELIKQGKKVQLAKKHVEKTFADENVSKFEQEIGFMKIIAVNTPNEGIIAALEGMKIRKDHFETMKKSNVPCLWIFGKKDNFISYNNFEKIKFPKNCETASLEFSGHQGYVEEINISEETILRYLKSIKLT